MFCYKGFLNSCGERTNAGKTEIDILAATFIGTFYSNNVSIVWCQGIQSLLFNRNILVGSQIAALLKRYHTVKVYCCIFIVMDSARKSLYLFLRESR